MKTTLVRYIAKPDTAAENQRLIESVFAELRATSPRDIRYMVLRLGDGTFVHVAVSDSEEGPSPLTRLDAFRAFQSGVKERCLEPPQVADPAIVGHYRMLDE